MLYERITNSIFIEQRKMSLAEERTHYLKLSLEEKRLGREETAKYSAEKLKLFAELKEMMQTKK